jgi:hypothetical protein
MLRHTCGVLATKHNLPIDVVQYSLGNASPEKTTIFSQGDNEPRSREMAKLNNFSNSPKLLLLGTHNHEQ